jgi:hypothetical protein
MTIITITIFYNKAIEESDGRCCLLLLLYNTTTKEGDDILVPSFFSLQQNHKTR